LIYDLVAEGDMGLDSVFFVLITHNS